jgi:hypothetical protein
MRLALMLALIPSVALAAAPLADLEGDARPAELAGKGTHYRLSRGQSLTLRLTGPASLALEVRAEGHAPAAVAPVIEQDGKPVPSAPMDVSVDPTVRSEKGSALSRASHHRVEVAAGRHAISLRWPLAASGDALVAIRGVQIAVVPDLGLPPLTTADLPPLALPASPPPASERPQPARADALALAPLALPAAAAQPRTRAITAVAVSGEPDFSRFGLDLHAGAQRSAETQTAAATIGSLGVDLAFHVSPLFSILGSVDGRLSRQGYQARQTALDGRGLAHADVDERRLDAFLGAGWDIGPWLVKSGRLELVPVLGAQATLVRNGAFPLDLAGPSAGARARFALSSAFALQAGARFTYNLLKGDTLSVVGSPVSDLALQAGVSLPLAGQYAFDVGYQGDLLALHYDTRVAHGVAVGFHAGL